MKIALLNVKYSANLGDGLLSECLEGALARSNRDIEVVSIDLAGRTEFSGGSDLRGPALAIIERLPRLLRGALMYVALKTLVALKLRRHYAQGLAGVDAVVLGGGNLIADSDLNFPMKISAALHEAGKLGLPVAVFGVGVGGAWSRTGIALFRRAFARSRLVDVTVRDDRSQTVWNNLLAAADIPAAGLARDPGLLVAGRYGVTGSRDSDRVGLCITDPVLLRYHAAAGTIGSDVGAWFRAVALALVELGHEVALFTNGSPEDCRFLDGLAPELLVAGQGRISRAPDFAIPADLVRFIAGCSLVIAHRMHACIAAHALGISTIGLAWDPKLDSFFAIAGREDFMASPDTVPPARLAALAARALAESPDADALAKLLAEGSRDVAHLGNVLADAVGQRR